MIKKITVKNYKSLEDVTIGLGRITVLIGENGCGKSNILEAIALASASAAQKLDNEFLLSRGVRVTDAGYMRSAFNKTATDEAINITIDGQDGKGYRCDLRNDNTEYSKWRNAYGVPISKKILAEMAKISEKYVKKEKGKEEIAVEPEHSEAMSKIFAELLKSNTEELCLDEYVIFSPENSALRSLDKEGHIQPLGINGEGLFKLLRYMQRSETKSFEVLKEHLRLIGWFEDIRIPDETDFSIKKMEIRDRFIDQSLSYFDQKSANEGFLLILFYLAVFLSEKTPAFFAIDNIDTSLNPKLCQRLIKDLAVLAKKYNKQAIFTTHNPAILDGLNLSDDEQQLWVVSRNRAGKTQVKRIEKPKVPEGQTPVKLSEAFLRGAIGGLPKRF